MCSKHKTSAQLKSHINVEVKFDGTCQHIMLGGIRTGQSCGKSVVGEGLLVCRIHKERQEEILMRISEEEGGGGEETKREETKRGETKGGETKNENNGEKKRVEFVCIDPNVCLGENCTLMCKDVTKNHTKFVTKSEYNCRICLDKGVCYVFLPCAHLCICEDCFKTNGTKCPLCRGNHTAMKVFTG
jgi:hypothetical protein